MGGGGDPHPPGEANRLSVQSAAYVNSTLQNAEVIQALGMLGPLRQRWTLVQQRIIAAQAHVSDRSARITATTRFVRISRQSLALGLGALLVLEGELSAGMMIAMSLLLGRALAPVEIAIGSWKQFNAGRQSYRRLTQLLTLHPPQRLRMPLPPPTGAVRVERLYVGPPGAAQPILRGINFALRKGEVLAVVGASASASGKSTLARALVGVWPAMGGSVRLDDAEISQWTHDAHWARTWDICPRALSCSTAASLTTLPGSASRTQSRSLLPAAMPVSTT